MKFFKELRNVELYRQLRIARNVENLFKIDIPRNVKDLLSLKEKLWDTLVRAPLPTATITAADYDCRVPPDGADPSVRNIFIHLKVRLSNLGKEETVFKSSYLQVPGSEEKLQPLIFKNDGGALTYISNSNVTPLPGGYTEELPLNFFFLAKKEITKDLKSTLVLNFQECQSQKISIKISRVRSRL
jgi:hypothetical protein